MSSWIGVLMGDEEQIFRDLDLHQYPDENEPPEYVDFFMTRAMSASELLMAVMSENMVEPKLCSKFRLVATCKGYVSIAWYLPVKCPLFGSHKTAIIQDANSRIPGYANTTIVFTGPQCQ